MRKRGMLQMNRHYESKFCEKLGFEQSMSKVGYPYDNAPMERYFNILKNDLIYPHSYNNYKTPYEARYGGV